MVKFSIQIRNHFVAIIIPFFSQHHIWYNFHLLVFESIKLFQSELPALMFPIPYYDFYSITDVIHHPHTTVNCERHILLTGCISWVTYQFWIPNCPTSKNQLPTRVREPSLPWYLTHRWRGVERWIHSVPKSIGTKMKETNLARIRIRLFFSNSLTITHAAHKKITRCKYVIS